MIIPQSYIEIFNADNTLKVTFDYINEVNISSTWEDLISSCTLTIPKKIKVRNSNQSLYIYPITAGDQTSATQVDKNPAYFRRGDTINIWLGYAGNLTLRFQGVITKITVKNKIQLHCEDDGFRLKQSICPSYPREKTSNNFPQDFAATRKLSDLLKLELPIDPRTGKQYKFHCDDITIGKFTIEKVSVIQFLNYLKQHFGFSVYFRDNTISVGLAYEQQNIASFSNPDTPINVFQFQRNIISDSLEYFRAEDVKYRINIIIWTKDNVKTELPYNPLYSGDVDGEIRTFNFYDVTIADAKRLAANALNRYKYTGFRGSFTGFLDPIVKHGDAIQLVDPVIPDRNGVYLVKKVVTGSGVNGGRQTIYLDRTLTP